jgi:hypothetical protein
VGAIIDLQLDRGTFMFDESSTATYGEPTSSDPHVVEQIVSRHECPANNQCLTFWAKEAGESTIQMTAPAEVGARPQTLRFEITVENPAG